MKIVDMQGTPGSKAGQLALIWRNEKHAVLSMLARSP